MKLIETASNSTGTKAADILGEEVNVTEQVESTAKNLEDFEVDESEFNNPVIEETKNQVTEELKTETVKQVEKVETKAPDGTITTQTVTTESTGLNEVKAKSVKPNMMFIMWDLFVPKIGGALAKDTPKEHWKLDPADKADLSTLITESAKEGDWKGVPTKWFLLLAIAAIIIVKVRTYKDKKIESEGESANNGKTKTLEQTYAEMKAIEDAKLGVAKYEETIQRLEKQNNKLQRMFDEWEKTGTLKKSDYYEEIKAEDLEKANGLVSEAKKIINTNPSELSNIYEDFNLDEIKFSFNGGFVELDKAGTKGYNDKGVKLGQPSAIMKKVFNQWKDYHTKKTGYIPYYVA